MKQNNRKKVFLSLLIALAFILPTGSVLGAVGEADANEGPSSTPTMTDSISAGLTADGRNPYQSLGNCIVDICGINLLPMMPVGEYDITVELEKICGFPQDCDVKLFLDVYKLDPLPNEEIYCTDFEDPADIYNNWDSIDDTTDSTSGPGGIDTFTWTDKRSHSPTHSFRCTQFDDHYMGNQLDYLETHLENVPDGSGGFLYDEIELQFWHYCDGELVDGGGSGLIPEDYGEVEVSFNYGGLWNTWGEIYTETEDEDENLVWLPESLNVSGVSSTPEIWYRWKWVTGPTIQNEGWYIDDVCFYGRQMPHPDFLFQTHSLHEITLVDPITEYTFPTTWFAEPGTYQFEIWMINETWGCDIVYPQANKFIFVVEIGDFVDLGITYNDYLGTSPFMMGDDLLVEGEVTNYGTIDAIDVPFTLSIKEQIITTHMMDYVEGTYYDPDDYDPYADEVFEDPEGIWQAHDFGSYGGAWHINTDFDFVSPNHAIICADGTNYLPAGLQDNLCLDFAALGWDPVDYEDAIEVDLVGQTNYRFGATVDSFCGIVRVGSSWVSLSSSYLPPASNTPGWVDWSFSDHISMYMNPSRPDLISVFAWIGGIFGTGLVDVTGCGVSVAGGGYGLDTVGGAGGAWSGLQFDNMKLYSIVPGAEVFKTVIILPEIKAETYTDPADVIFLDFADGLLWEDMPTGNYIEEKFVPNDVIVVDDPINDDNAPPGKSFKVITDITCVDELDVEHMDLTTCDGEWWHITSSGYNNYAWCGDETTGVYASNWNEALMLVSDDNSAHDSSLASMDWSADAFGVFMDFDSYEDFEGDPFDPGYIEINPHVSEPGSHWYTYFIDFGYYYPYWYTWNLAMTPFDFTDPVTSNPFLVDEPGGFTDDMGLRFRFISDASWEYRGWLVDNILITGASEDIYEINPCDDMDRFIATGICGGDWWYEDIGFGGWTCQDQLALFVPNDINNALVWSTSVPQAISAELTFEHDYDLELGFDYCYLEFSTDGGSNWIAPVAFSGTGSGTYSVDMSAFTGDNVLIRWRMVTDSAVTSDHYSVKDMCITGQVDLMPPATTGTLSGTVIHGWYSSPVTFTATATDDVSGVAAIYYKIDGGSTLTYSAPITISTNGEHYIEYWAVDNVGNEEAHHMTASFKIDTGTAPSVAITAPTAGLYLFGNQLLSMSKVFIIGGFTVQATASDSDSGVYKVEFQLDGTTFGESTSAPYSAYCGQKHTGAGTITAIAEDFTGNTAQDTLAVTYFKFL